MKSQPTQRIVTGSLLGILVLGAIFLPAWAFLVFTLVTCTWAAAELVPILRHWTPQAPLGALVVLIPPVSLAGVWMTDQDTIPTLWILVLPAACILAATFVVLWSRTPVDQGVVAVGFLALGLPYFAVPIVSLYLLHSSDPWLVLALILVVSLGDTAAYFFGTWKGRRPMAPRISPKKSWEGSIAGGLASLATIGGWCLFRGETLRWEWFALAAVTEVAAQIGDLLESLAKRGAGVKDSSHLLPGHGGLYDRIDAMLLAAPVFLFVLALLGLRQDLSFALAVQ